MSKISFREAFSKQYPKYVQLIDKFGDANDIENPDWADVTKLNLSNFVEYLQDNAAATSVRTYCSMVKAVLNRYTEEEEFTKDFERILTVKGCVSQQTWLTDKEIEILINYKPCSDTERLVRNLFVLECLTGARNSDVVKFTKENIVGNHLVYVSEKTHIKSDIPLSPIVVTYLEELLSMDCKVSKTYFNKMLRHICEYAGITDRIKLFRSGVDMEGEKWQFVASHTGRRSFASNLYLSGCDLLTISKLMGHSDVSMTARYIVCPPRITDRVLKYFEQFSC